MLSHKKKKKKKLNLTFKKVKSVFFVLDRTRGFYAQGN